jgi:hypothetical protein
MADCPGCGNEVPETLIVGNACALCSPTVADDAIARIDERDEYRAWGVSQ